jgi:hypothetical protein
LPVRTHPRSTGSRSGPQTHDSRRCRWRGRRRAPQGAATSQREPLWAHLWSHPHAFVRLQRRSGQCCYAGRGRGLAACILSPENRKVAPLSPSTHGQSPAICGGSPLTAHRDLSLLTSSHYGRVLARWALIAAATRKEPQTSGSRGAVTVEC